MQNFATVAIFANKAIIAIVITIYSNKTAHICVFCRFHKLKRYAFENRHAWFQSIYQINKNFSSSWAGTARDVCTYHNLQDLHNIWLGNHKMRVWSVELPGVGFLDFSFKIQGENVTVKLNMTIQSERDS